MFYENVEISRVESRVVVCCDVRVNEETGLSDEFCFDLEVDEDRKNLRVLLLDMIEDLMK